MKDNSLVMSRKIIITEYGGYELECGIKKLEKSIYIKNLVNNKMVSGQCILLEEGIDLVDAENLHIRCDDREFGCFGGAINEVNDNPTWYSGISIDEVYESSYEFLHRIIRFKNEDITDEERFNVSQDWIDNPST